MRAGAIAWIARFIPEAIPTDTGMVIAATTGRLHRYPDHRTHGWFRTLHLDAALFALSGEERCLTDVLSNIDHGSGRLREAVLGPPGEGQASRRDGSRRGATFPRWRRRIPT